jgi:hypothetical protein
MAQNQPKNAEANIIPSIPIFTTPDLSQNTPQRAPRVNGVATEIVVAIIEARITIGGVVAFPINKTTE